jgi:cytochrome c oxidase subunit 2
MNPAGPHRAGAWAFAALMSGCKNDIAVFMPAGIQARRIESLWWLYFGILVTIFALVLATLLMALIRGGRRAPGEAVGAAADHPLQHPILAPSPAVERRLTWSVALSLALTIVVLFALLWTSFRTGKAIADHGPQPELVIQITGRRWWWQIRYQDLTASHIVETANELHLPVGRPIRLELTSADVIHSFWVPRLHGKRDLIPGTVATSVIQADEPGTYLGQCAEFCGLQHAHMGIMVIAEPQQTFQAWLTAQRLAAPEPTTDMQRRGRDVFLTGPCVMCHSIGGTIAGAQSGPNLTHFASRQTLAAGTLPNTRGHLAGWILDPQQIKPGVSMPPNPMPSDDLHALLAYLETLR